jgi:hypothetical protein
VVDDYSDELVALTLDLYKEFISFEIVPKADSLLMKAANGCLLIITFGMMRGFMTRFITVVGETVYVPPSWVTTPPDAKIATLRHERVHMRQKKKYSFPLFVFLFLFFPFPTVFAYYRAKFEKEAYAESIRAYYALYGPGVLDDKELRDNTIRHFTSAEYFWMWPWRRGLERWYDGVIAELRGS